jgi:two-component system NtrC family sensor kinase
VPAARRGQIFHPFFTTKPVGTGSGLGLPICFGLVRDHGGEIALDPDYADGARFTVSLPIRMWRPGEDLDAPSQSS